MDLPPSQPAPVDPGPIPPLPELLEQIAILRRANHQLRVAAADPTLHARFAAIVESSDDAIISKNLQGIIQTWNQGAQRIFGWEAHEVIGKAINILIPPDRQDEEPQILARLQRGERVDHFETVRITKTGQLIDISVTISPIRDDQGRVVAASKIARDISLQKRIQRELQIAKEAAETANRAKDHFLSILSHELRTPLTPVLGELTFLEQSTDVPPDLRATLAMIRRNVETEARLVDDLLDLTRISRGKLQLRFEAVDLHDAIRSVVAMIQSQVDAKRIELTVGLRARTHFVWADSGRLQQVFLNILSNAVKFTPDAGAIAIRTDNPQGDDAIEIDISDNGIGIEPDMMSRLFTAFEQSERTRRFGGLGLGLSIARSLLDLHRGSIAAFSEGRDRGARFLIQLPLTARRSQPPQPPPADDLSRLAGFRVLLVEDHHDTRAVMLRLLLSLGCSVETASSVREAADLARDLHFDLLISDIGLPDGSGIDVVRSFHPRKIPAIALSGYGQEDDIQRSRDAGFDTHLVKPINFESLRDTIFRLARSS